MHRYLTVSTPLVVAYTRIIYGYYLEYFFRRIIYVHRLGTITPIYSLDPGSSKKNSEGGVAIKNIIKGILAGMMISCPTKGKRDAISYNRWSL